MNYFSGTGGNPGPDAKNLAAHKSPAQVIVLVDSVNMNSPAPDANKDPANATTGNGLNMDYTINDDAERLLDPGRGLPRHTQRNNFAFCDGHVHPTPILPDWNSGSGPVKATMDRIMPWPVWSDEYTTNGWGTNLNG